MRPLRWAVGSAMSDNPAQQPRNAAFHHGVVGAFAPHCPARHVRLGPCPDPRSRSQLSWLPPCLS